MECKITMLQIVKQQQFCVHLNSRIKVKTAGCVKDFRFTVSIMTRHIFFDRDPFQNAFVKLSFETSRFEVPVYERFCVSVTV